MVESANKPLVSVVMPAFNESPDMIKGAINSILEQTYKNIELHIYDDSTLEKTRAVIDAFCEDPRVTIHRSDKRTGFIKSLNLGLEASKGKYIARMDADDYSFPDRLEKEVGFLEAHPGVMIAGGQMNIMDREGNITSFRAYPTNAWSFFFFSCVRNPMAHPTVMMRRDIVDQGYRYDETLRMSEDLDFWLRLMNDGYRLANIPDTVLNYRVMDNFLEKRSSDIQREVMAQVRYKNFSSRHLVHSILSVITGWLFTHVPRTMINRAYNRENNRK